MKTITIFSTFLYISCIAPRGIICGFFDSVLGIIWQPDSTLSPTPATFPETTTEEIKLALVEDAIFQAAARFQECYAPNDDQAKLNYIMSPVSAVILVTQLLLGTYGIYHEYLEEFLQLSPIKRKRAVEFINLTRNKLYEEITEHPVFHWKLRRLLKEIKAKNNDYDIKLENALIYDEEHDMVEYFVNNIKKFYQTELIKVDFEDLKSSNITSKWTNFMRKNLNNDVKINGKAVLFNTFEFNATWEGEFLEAWMGEPFFIRPYINVSIAYIEGTVRNTTYIENKHFKLVMVPLKSHTAKLYIVQPKRQTYHIRSFSESLQDFNVLREIEAIDPSSYRDVRLKVPNIFKYKTGRMDLMKPISNDLINLKGKNGTSIYLNKASEALRITNVFSQYSFSIKSKWDTRQAPASQETNKPPLPRVTFEVNSPFVFFIMHAQSEAVLIWGSISDPSKV